MLSTEPRRGEVKKHLRPLAILLPTANKICDQTARPEVLSLLSRFGRIVLTVGKSCTKVIKTHKHTIEKMNKY